MFQCFELARDCWSINPAFVIDIGAAEGKWSLEAAEVWPQADFILVEPLLERQAELEKLAHSKGWTCHSMLAGNKKQIVEFTVTDDLDGSGVYQHNAGEKRLVPMCPLDDFLPLEGRGFLKLDTHGFEGPILDGASHLLKQVDLLMIEVYGSYISPSCLLFDQLASLLREKYGFRVAHIINVMNRPGDRIFWQADFVFLKEDHLVFRQTTYK